MNRWLSVPLHKRYDLYGDLFPETTTIYRNCRILGLTGVNDDHSGMISKSSAGRHHEWFDDMLVLELSDGRLAYVPVSSVKYFEETAESMQATSGYHSPPVDRFR